MFFRISIDCLRLFWRLFFLVKSPCFKKNGGSSNLEPAMGFCSHFLRSNKRACYPPKPSQKLFRQSVAIKNYHPPPIRTPVSFHHPKNLSYRTSWTFSKSAPCVTVTIGHKISACHSLSVNLVLLSAILHRHSLAGCITANYEHNPTVKSNICLTGRPQSATFCMQNKGIKSPQNNHAKKVMPSPDINQEGYPPPE